MKVLNRAEYYIDVWTSSFFMNKQLKINKGFFTAIISAFSDLDASIDQQFELRDKESQLLPFFILLV